MEDSVDKHSRNLASQEKENMPSSKEKEITPIPIKKALPQIKRRIQDIINKYGNAVVIIEGAWATGKTTFSKAFETALKKLCRGPIILISIDEEVKNATSFLGQRPDLYKGENLISVLSTHTHSLPNNTQILIIDGATMGDVLLNRYKIDPTNVVRINFYTDTQTQWENLYERYRDYYDWMGKVLYTIEEYPPSINPEADFNVDNSCSHRLSPDTIQKILSE